MYNYAFFEGKSFEKDANFNLEEYFKNSQKEINEEGDDYALPRTPAKNSKALSDMVSNSSFNFKDRTAQSQKDITLSDKKPNFIDTKSEKQNYSEDKGCQANFLLETANSQNYQMDLSNDIFPKYRNADSMPMDTNRLIKPAPKRSKKKQLNCITGNCNSVLHNHIKVNSIIKIIVNSIFTGVLLLIFLLTVYNVYDDIRRKISLSMQSELQKKEYCEKEYRDNFCNKAKRPRALETFCKEME